MGITRIVRSSCRQRILKALSDRKEVNVMKLVRVTNSTFNEVDRNLRILEAAGFIIQKRTKGKRIIFLKVSNEKTLKTLQTLRALEAANSS